MKLTQRLAVILLGAAGIVGCSHEQPPVTSTEVNQNPMAQVSDAAANEIAESAAQVSHSLSNLEAVEKANMAPQAARLYPQVAQMNIPGTSSIDWNGPIEPLLKQIAQAGHYRLKVYGNKPITPIIVNIHAVDTANADVVRDAALQATTRATVKTNPTNKTIELRYLGQ